MRVLATSNCTQRIFFLWIEKLNELSFCIFIQRKLNLVLDLKKIIIKVQNSSCSQVIVLPCNKAAADGKGAFLFFPKPPCSHTSKVSKIILRAENRMWQNKRAQPSKQ